MPQPTADTSTHPPMLDTYGPHQARPFSRTELRRRVGPSNPTYHLLENLVVQDVVTRYDDFDTTLNTAYWTATNSGGAGVSNFARLASTLAGVAEGDPGTDNAGDVRLFATSNLTASSDTRPVLLTRVRQVTNITSSKFEVGLAAAVQAGQVNVKATPSATGVDFSVIIRDTTDNTSVDIAHARAASGVQRTAGAAALPVWAVTTYFTLMLAVDETVNSYFWINGIFGGVVRGTGPATGTQIGPWFFAQNRTGSSHPLDIDYAKYWHERVVFV